MLFLNLFSVAFESFLYGILLAVATIAIMYFVLQLISRTCVKTTLFYLSVIALSIFLVIQDTLLIAAFMADGMVTDAEILIQQQVGTHSQALDMKEVHGVLDTVSRGIPLLGVFANITNVQVDNAQDLASEIATLFHDYLHAYMWRRVGWCSAAMFVAALIICLADKRAVQEAPSRNRRTGGFSGRASNQHSVRSGRRHRF